MIPTKIKVSKGFKGSTRGPASVYSDEHVQSLFLSLETSNDIQSVA